MCAQSFSEIRLPNICLVQSRRFDPPPAASGLPRTTDIAQFGRQVRFVPQAEVIPTKRKAARRRLLNSPVDQAAIKAGFDFLRYAMKPMPAKPRSSNARTYR